MENAVSAAIMGNIMGLSTVQPASGGGDSPDQGMKFSSLLQALENSLREESKENVSAELVEPEDMDDPESFSPGKIFPNLLFGTLWDQRLPSLEEVNLDPDLEQLLGNIQEEPVPSGEVMSENNQELAEILGELVEGKVEMEASPEVPASEQEQESELSAQALPGDSEANLADEEGDSDTIVSHRVAEELGTDAEVKADPEKGAKIAFAKSGQVPSQSGQASQSKGTDLLDQTDQPSQENRPSGSGKPEEPSLRINRGNDLPEQSDQASQENRLLGSNRENRPSGSGSLGQVEQAKPEEPSLRINAETGQTARTVPPDQVLPTGGVASPQSAMVSAFEISGTGGIQAPERAVLEQVVQAVQSSELTTEEGKSVLNISLKPEYLGKLRLVVTMERGVINAHFFAQNQMAASLIDSQLPELKETFNQQGISWQEVSVSVSQDETEASSEQGMYESQAGGESNPKEEVSSGRAYQYGSLGEGVIDYVV